MREVKSRLYTLHCNLWLFPVITKLWDFPDYVIVDTALDGSCFFHALSHQLRFHNYTETQQSVESMRAEVVNFINVGSNLKAEIAMRVTEQSIDQYLQSMLLTKTWADYNIIAAAALFYDVTIHIITPGYPVPTVICSSPERNVFLGYVSLDEDEEPSHYVSLIRKNAGK